ncbi:MAG: UPF0753 protein [Planctomycetaceae bacterium]|nr:MAG: UPF0753 protein [Planctomycetaceae bacterium]
MMKTRQRSSRQSKHTTQHPPSVQATEIDRILLQVLPLIPPAWPLRDGVAVNPWAGWAHVPFWMARHRIRQMWNAELLMSWEYYQEQYRLGTFDDDDLGQAVEDCRSFHPEIFADIDLEQVRRMFQQSQRAKPIAEPRWCTLAEQYDNQAGTNWNATIIEAISIHCAAHFDAGQANWKSPWRETSLYAAWRQRSRIDWSMRLLGCPHFQDVVANLPDDPRQALLILLREMQIPSSWWHDALLCTAYSMAGWSAYVRYRDLIHLRAGKESDDLSGLLAIRLAYDLALSQSTGYRWQVPQLEQGSLCVSQPLEMGRYLGLVASEIAYRRALCTQLASRIHFHAPQRTPVEAQLVFCIDVRSEPIRRYLEAFHPAVQTYGFAGFFGMPLEVILEGESNGRSQCPALISPTVKVFEQTAYDSLQNCVDDRGDYRRKSVKAWKFFQTSAISCFSFVESLGWLWGGKLLIDALGMTRWGHPHQLMRWFREAGGTRMSSLSAPDLTLDRKVSLAEGLLRNLGMTDQFAPLVVLCGHTSATVNNPQKAFLDCGACGGHSGETNARFAAQLLNDSAVRAGLSSHGIEIPAETWFLAAVHHTTTDEIEYPELMTLPASHHAIFQRLQRAIQQAAEAVRQERAQHLGCSASDLPMRSRDWSQVRPEWGLAGNAAFVIAPRERTKGLNLQGRVFLHDYDSHRDPQGDVLESIFAGPTLVTSWINLQYYASTVDPSAWGSGNKTLHNVVGEIGVFEGNGGDLACGLPQQSVSRGGRLVHTPLRLQVIVEAPRSRIDRLLSQQKHLRDLVEHSWIWLLAIDEHRFYLRAPQGRWLLKSQDSLKSLVEECL